MVYVHSVCVMCVVCGVCVVCSICGICGMSLCVCGMCVVCNILCMCVLYVWCVCVSVCTPKVNVRHLSLSLNSIF